MLDNKLVTTLSALKKREITRFIDFVYSPYFNKHEHTRILCDYLCKQAPQFKDKKKLSKERIYKNIFKGEKFNSKKLNRQCSLLLALLHQFLRIEEQTLNQPAQELFLLKTLRKRKSFKNYDSVKRKYEQDLLKHPYSRADHLFLQELQYQSEANNLFVDLQQTKRETRKFNPALQRNNDALDNFFILQKLTIACEMASRKVLLKDADYNPSLLDVLLPKINEHRSNYPLVIQVYADVYQFLTCPEEQKEAYYMTIKQLLQSGDNSLLKEDLRAAYFHLINYAVKQINRGRTQFYEEVLEHYEFLVKSKIIFRDGYLTPAIYTNMTTAALFLERYEWTIQFLEEYKEFLPPKSRKNIYAYNLAFVYYSKGDHSQALLTVHDIEFVDYSLNIRTRILQIKSYYELKEGEALDSLIEAAYMYLKRNTQIPAYWVTATINFIKLCKRLHKLREQKDYIPDAEFNKKKESIGQTLLRPEGAISNLDWLKKSFNDL